MPRWYRVEHNGNIHLFNKDRISSVEIHPTAPSGISEAQPWYGVNFYADGAEPIARMIFADMAEAQAMVMRFLGDDPLT